MVENIHIKVSIKRLMSLKIISTTFLEFLYKVCTVLLYGSCMSISVCVCVFPFSSIPTDSFPFLIFSTTVNMFILVS